MYNKNGDAWAVVTGGSDGIGLGLCRNLAKLGFNICIVSRNLQKINERLELIKKDNKVKTLAIQADFSNMHSIE